MPISQNLKFTGEAPIDTEFDYPFGASIMRKLESELLLDAWELSSFDNWRDCGWFVLCQKGDAKMEVVLGAVEDFEWLLQISPSYKPGFIGRLLKKSNSASEQDILGLSIAIHKIISSERFYDKLMWCWDDYPEEGSSSLTPQAPN